MIESWIDLEGIEFDNDKYTYQVSDKGRVRRIWIDKEYNIHTKLLKQQMNESGYMRVCINRRQYKVHRLVALAFINNTEDKEQVNHINHCKTDNRVDNLEWNTNKENNSHLQNRLNTSITLERNKGKIIVVIKDNKIIGTHTTSKEVSETYGINRKTLYNCLRDNKQRWKGLMFDRV